MSQTIYQVGCLFAELTCSYLTDRYGRKIIHIISQVGVVVFGIGTAFAQTYVSYVALRTTTGFFVVVSCTNYDGSLF